MANLVYGQPYCDIFLNLHLRSFLDPTNAHKWKKRLEYLLFTDSETAPVIKSHPAFRALGDVLSVSVQTFGWQNDQNKYESRYGVQVTTFDAAVREALKRGTYLQYTTADTVYAKNYLDQTFRKLDAGHDAIMINPIRATLESVTPNLIKYTGAAPALELFDIAYSNLHPLSIAAHWDCPTFSKIPDVLYWNSGKGLLQRPFSLSPISISPNESMVGLDRVMDAGLQPLLKNPYFCNDWLECPLVGAEPIMTWYSPFSNKRAGEVNFLERETIPHRQVNVGRKFFYPSEEIANFGQPQLMASDIAVAPIFASINSKSL